MLIQVVFVLLLLHVARGFFQLPKHRFASSLRMNLDSAPDNHGNSMKRTLLKGLSVAASTVFVVSSNAVAKTFEPIERGQRPDISEAAILPSIGIRPDYVAVRKDLEEIIKSKPDKGPTLVRLAWHSSGTYDAMSKTGGSQGGTIRFKEELAHGANAGLDVAVSWLEPIYKKYNKNADLSYADLYTLAGVVAISTLGGPQVPWRAGRVDAIDASVVTPDGRLPDADKGSTDKTLSGIRKVFNRMGFNDQEIVALSGAHALGRCHASASGYNGPWTPTPTKFNNLYFSLLVNLKWAPNQKVLDQGGKFQYQDPSGKLMMLPSDLALIEDTSFKKYVETYAKDEKRFFADFTKAFQKLEELGTSNLYEV